MTSKRQAGDCPRLESEWQSWDLNSEWPTPGTSSEPQGLLPRPLCGSSSRLLGHCSVPWFHNLGWPSRPTCLQHAQSYERRGRALGGPRGKEDLFAPGDGWPMPDVRPSGHCHTGECGLLSPRCLTGAPDGPCPEAHPLCHLVPSCLSVCFCCPEPTQPSQQAFLPPLCGEPAWRGT